MYVNKYVKMNSGSSDASQLWQWYGQVYYQYTKDFFEGTHNSLSIVEISARKMFGDNYNTTTTGHPREVARNQVKHYLV